MSLICSIWQIIPRNNISKNISNNFSSSSPSLFHPDGSTAISSVYKAELSLRLLLMIIQHWMIVGLYLPHPHPLTKPCMIWRFLYIMFSIPSLILTLRRLMVWMESLLSSSETVLSCSYSIWSNLSVLVYQHPPFLHARSTPTFNLSQINVTALIFQTTILTLTFCLSTAFESIINRRFPSTNQLMIFYLIGSSTDSTKRYPLAIFGLP